MNTAVKNDQDLESLVGRVADEFLRRQDAGERPDVEEYVARHPHAAEVLRNALAALQLFDASGARGGGIAPAGGGEVGTLGDYRIVREVGRGGMGIVYEAEQLSLGRRVALKVLPLAATMDPRQLQRFKNEARAAASLHHEHIAPVHGVGEERGVHYYAMQFIDGQTLEALIRDRRAARAAAKGEAAPPPDANATVTAAGTDCGASPTSPPTVAEPRAWASTLASLAPKEYYRRVAEWGIQAAEALEYAHERGIVHRDIKPGNLMLDAYGKLWVTDFGLARTAGDSGLTGTGDVLGTLRYMSPEQALAKHGLVDHRTDVYSLGMTLYELLTLRPAVDGKDREEILNRLTFEEPAAPRRHDRAIPPDLETVILKALGKEPGRRYATAAELASDLRRFLEDKPIQARRPGVVERARKWSRRHPTLVRSVAVGVLAAVAVAGGAAGWFLSDEAARRAEAERVARPALAEAETLAQQKKWPEALSVARLAEGAVAGREAPEELRRAVQHLLTDLQMVPKLENAYLAGTGVKDERFDSEASEAAYREAFHWYGLDVEGLKAEEVGRRTRGRLIQVELAAALDHWTLIRRGLSKPGDESWRGLLAAARAIDTDDWRNRVRDAMERRDAEALRQLAAVAGDKDLPAPTLALLGRILLHTGAAEQAAALLRQAQQGYPADFWINHDLALALQQNSERKAENLGEAIRYYQAALTLRPRSPGVHFNLGLALHAKERLDEAIARYREAVRLKPGYASAHLSLGNALREKGLVDEAITAYKEAIRLKEDQPKAHRGLGLALHVKGLLDDAIASFKEAIRLKEGFAEAHHNLSAALRDKGRLDEAITHIKQAVRLKEDDHEAHYNLGTALGAKGQLDEAIASFREAIRLKEDYIKAHNNLGVTLTRQGKLDEAIICYREAIRLNKDAPLLRYNLGVALSEKGRLGDAIDAWREAIRLDPGDADPHHRLANALQKQGRLDEALTAGREAVRCTPTNADSHYLLGNLLRARGRLDEAIDAYREAIRLKDDHAPARTNLGVALLGKGRQEEARDEWRKAVACQPDYAAAHNNLARLLATSSDPRVLDPRQAVAHGLKAVELTPDDGRCWNTLGAAHYRNADWKSAVEALTKATQLTNGGAASDWLFLAMACWRLGDKDQARAWYDKAVAWMDRNRSQDQGLHRYRATAAAMLGIKEPQPNKEAPAPKR